MTRLVTVVFEVADLDRSLALYRDAFGLDLHLRDHHGAAHETGDRWISGRHAATSWTDGAFLHFALYESKGERRPPRRSASKLPTSRHHTSEPFTRELSSSTKHAPSPGAAAPGTATTTGTSSS